MLTPDQIAAIRKRADDISIQHDQCEDSLYSCPLSDEGCANDSETDCTCDQPQRVALKRDIDELLAEIDTLSAWEPGRWFRIMTPDGRLWSETSDWDEARATAERTGWPIVRLWRRESTKWVPEGNNP